MAGGRGARTRSAFSPESNWTKHVGGDKQFESMSLLLNISNRVAPSVPLAYKIGVALKLLGKK